MQEAIKTGTVSNQASELIYSQDEDIPMSKLSLPLVAGMAIAKALDRAGVLFLPNCVARLNGDKVGNNIPRVYKEPDFLVFYKGKWGILEVDGEAFHASAAKNHDRSRLFRK